MIYMYMVVLTINREYAIFHIKQFDSECISYKLYRFLLCVVYNNMYVHVICIIAWYEFGAQMKITLCCMRAARQL